MQVSWKTRVFPDKPRVLENHEFPGPPFCCRSFLYIRSHIIVSITSANDRSGWFSFQASCLAADGNACKVKSSQSSCRMGFEWQNYCRVWDLKCINCTVIALLAYDFFCFLCISSHMISVPFASFTFVFSTFISPKSPKSYRTESPSGFVNMSRVLLFLGCPKLPKANI